ncbi:hypothetical protein E4T44_03011 [Aureobasidium sp. EXF-8845]|nr:hypothetical protein E4T44_03011 [Aureobasidium sp. EXF-8845]KAI4855599.1 hypothetical protein E4T45_02958 [Aureobasidium sp. EXF-8846]
MASQAQIDQILLLVQAGIPLTEIPAGRPPAGEVSHIHHAVGRTHMITTCDIICIIIVCTVVAMRFYTRIALLKNLWWDDYDLGCTLFALACWIGETGLFQYACKFGAGKHIYDLSVADLYPNLLRGWVICAIMYSVTMFFSKMSILLLYRRLFPIVNFAKQWWAVVAFTVAYSVGAIFASWFQCRPMASAWTLDIPSDYCISTEKFYTANAALNVVSDVMILLLPIPIVWGLNTDTRKKIIVTGLFSMGFISCLVSILRMRSIIVLYQSGYDDLTWGLVEVVLWSQAELTAAMICTCTPCLRPLFEKVIPALRSVTSRKGTHGSNTNTGGYLRTGDYESKSTASKSKSFATDDVEMDAGIRKKVSYDVKAIGTDDSDSQKSIMYR